MISFSQNFSSFVNQLFKMRLPKNIIDKIGKIFITGLGYVITVINTSLYTKYITYYQKSYCTAKFIICHRRKAIVNSLGQQNRMR